MIKRCDDARFFTLFFSLHLSPISASPHIRVPRLFFYRCLRGLGVGAEFAAGRGALK